ncbi:uncharacterized protein LOC129304924 [Prosopis cineraria]|uniref:uncharacterized protein LOC129304924 n=1 Tax=Prosopis cineraria TaxID=364024 RepID=UPI00240F4EA8|nr:uncharacterized protein LOC129304924 [Prosopis cineraria]
MASSNHMDSDAHHYDMLNSLDLTKISRRILVKVDHIYPCVGDKVYELDLGYPKHARSINLMVFDAQGTRMEVLIKGPEILARFRNRFKVDKTYDITNLEVNRGGQPVHRKYHISLLLCSEICEHSSNFLGHNFKLCLVYDLKASNFPSSHLIDVAGLCVHVGDLKWENVEIHDGLLTRKLWIVLQDIQRDMIPCVLQRDYVVDAWTTYQACKDHKSLLYVVIRYAILFRGLGSNCLEEFKNATKVYWYIDPLHPDLAGSDLAM